MTEDVNHILQQEAYQYALPPPTTRRARLIGPTGPVKRACPSEDIEREVGFRKEFRISAVRGTALRVTNWQKRSMFSGWSNSCYQLWILFMHSSLSSKIQGATSLKRCKQQHKQRGATDVSSEADARPQIFFEGPTMPLEKRFLSR